MTLPASGPISLSQVQTEFGGENPISMSEYYRNGPYMTDNNSGVPTGNQIGMSDLRGTYKAFTVVYEVIGGGGAGGFGVDDGGEGYRGTYAPSGSDSVITFPDTTITSSGAQGGENCKGNRATAGENGFASYYGDGGAGGSLNNYGADAVNAGSGGGGGGGDSGSLFDSGGCSGGGGQAATRQAGTYYLAAGGSISINVGSGGIAAAINYKGGDGAVGYVKLVVDGTEYTYATAGSYVLTP